MKIANSRSAYLLLMVVMIAALAPARPSTPPETVSCRVMESEASARFGIRLVIFHYRDVTDRERLSRLLRAYDGRTVQFQALGQRWRAGTLFRLKVCFGRGLLVFPISAPTLAKGGILLIRFSAP